MRPGRDRAPAQDASKRCTGRYANGEVQEAARGAPSCQKGRGRCYNLQTIFTGRSVTNRQAIFARRYPATGRVTWSIHLGRPPVRRMVAKTRSTLPRSLHSTPFTRTVPRREAPGTRTRSEKLIEGRVA